MGHPASRGGAGRHDLVRRAFWHFAPGPYSVRAAKQEGDGLIVWQAAEQRPFFMLGLLALLLFLPGLFTLPPIDRDEARFAQASKQMLESGNLVDIRFQDVPRYKKPVGIYWLQAASARLLGAPPYDEIWAYRIPSLLGALASVLLTFWAGRPLFGPRAALIGAALLAATIMLGAEARLAKTDAVLLACVMLAQGVLARAYLGQRLSWPLAMLFWVAQGLGVLIKGPIAPLISGLTILGLGLWDRRGAWLKRLRPLLGLPLFAAIVLPWLVAIGLATHGQFFSEAVGGDMASKLAGGQESHGAPPGTYLVLAILTFWPGTLVLLPAIGHALRERAAAPYRFALAWAVPAWLFFELVPTKLPHYVLPLYPALALLCGAVIVQAPGRLQTRLGMLALAGFAGAGLAFVLLLGGLQRLSDGVYHPLDLACAGLALVFCVLAALAFRRKTAQRAAAFALAASFTVTGSALGLIGPHLDAPFIAPRLVAALPHTGGGPLPPLIVSGYSEPSLVFLAGTGTRFEPPERAAEALALSSHGNTVAAISTAAQAAFLAEMRALDRSVLPIGAVSGFNYSVGKPVTLILYKARP